MSDPAECPACNRHPCCCGLWHNDEIQFARLLCEIQATQENLDIGALSVSMDLSPVQISEIFDRAVKVFEASKEAYCR